MIRIDLKPVGKGKAEMFVNGENIGVSSEPLFAAARWLLAHDLAKPDDKLGTYRGELLCMSAPVGIAANMTIAEDSRGGMRFTKWRSLHGYSPADQRNDDPSGLVAA